MLLYISPLLFPLQPHWVCLLSLNSAWFFPSYGMFLRFQLSEMASLAFFLSDSTYSPGSMSNNVAPWNLHSPWQPRTSLNSKCLPSILWKLLSYRFLDLSHVVLITQYCNDLNFKLNLGNYRKYMVVTKIKFTSIPIACDSGPPN